VIVMSDSYNIRKFYLGIEEIITEGSRPDREPLIKVVSAAVISNPHANQHGDDLAEMISWGTTLGTLLGERAVAALGGQSVQSYGKGAIVGTAGEQEHGTALLTTAFGDALRDAVGGGKAWISSTVKRGGIGTRIDVPLAHKDALYVRNNYDLAEVRIPDAPLPNEIVVIAVIASRGRLDARCGGPRAEEIIGKDGLR